MKGDLGGAGVYRGFLSGLSKESTGQSVWQLPIILQVFLAACPYSRALAAYVGFRVSLSYRLTWPPQNRELGLCCEN